MAKDSQIRARLNRTEEIIEQLDADECSPEAAAELHEEGNQLLEEIRELAHEGEGDVMEIE
jgi:exodeoxyribonuclease VII small subunit